MKVLPEPIIFIWDKGNKDKNYLKHGITNKEAEEAFNQKHIILHKDEKHSIVEKRYMLWGKTDEDKSLSIIFTIRKNAVRIISARIMNRKERRAYEEKIKNNSKI